MSHYGTVHVGVTKVEVIVGVTRVQYLEFAMTDRCISLRPILSYSLAEDFTYTCVLVARYSLQICMAKGCPGKASYGGRNTQCRSWLPIG